MSLPKLIADFKSQTDHFDEGIEGGLLAVTISDVRAALGAGFSAVEVEYMLDLPEGRVTGLPSGRA